MSRESYSKKFFPQSLYRKPLQEGIQKYEQLEKINTTIPNFPDTPQATQKIIIQQVQNLTEKVIAALLPSYNFSGFIKEILTALDFRDSDFEEKPVPPSKIWNQIESPILNRLKMKLIEEKSDEIIRHYDKKIQYLVRNYSRYLPKYISDVEKDDLLSIAQIELLETIKAWVPIKNSDIWPLAHSRINGAMKDYIRFISKSDPARMFEWVSDSAVIYTHFKQESNPNIKIESGYELSLAMECLDEREIKILTAYVQEDKTFSIISQELNISESQISRIYKKIIEKLKVTLNQKK